MFSEFSLSEISPFKLLMSIRLLSDGQYPLSPWRPERTEITVRSRWDVSVRSCIVPYHWNNRSKKTVSVHLPSLNSVIMTSFYTVTDRIISIVCCAQANQNETISCMSEHAHHSLWLYVCVSVITERVWGTFTVYLQSQHL